jgi:hypothetical protein
MAFSLILSHLILNPEGLKTIIRYLNVKELSVLTPAILLFKIFFRKSFVAKTQCKKHREKFGGDDRDRTCDL